ncbi:MAG: fused MFS/spermidine synthase [Myxococcota bacterium]
MITNAYQRMLIYLLFFLSGSTGLAYEIIWSRKLTLIFGGTVYAVSTVLTVFFSGLALGAILIGREMDRGRNPIKTYVLLEILIGLFGIGSPLLFLGIDTIYYHVQPLVGSSLAGLTAIRFILSFLALIVPTTLMGATLPVLVKLVVRADQDVATNAGRLYAVNTLGAALGTILATIMFIPLMGVNGSLYATGLVNLIIAATAFVIFRGARAEPTRTARVEYLHTPLERYVLILFGIVGFISMVYQVAWIRLLIQITGSTIYTFGLMLSVFIVGVGLGSQIATYLLRWIRNSLLAFVVIEIAASAYSLLLVNYFDRLPLLFTSLALEQSGGFTSILLLKVLINAIVLLFPTLMFGAAFPIVASIFAGRAARSGGDIGSVYSFNTIGGVFGSFTAGFFILPSLGTQTTIVATSVAGLVVAALATARLERPFQKGAAFVACGGVLLASVVLYKPWNVGYINAAPYLLQYPSLEGMLDIADSRILYYDEGINVNVAVTGKQKPETIYINGKPMASTLLTDKANQYLLGHLPMLLHPDPKRSMVIGLGAGMTFGALVRYGEPSDVIEISPEVVAGARMFGEHNRNVLDRPEANVIFDDGRNYLSTTRQKYDVITEDPLDPFFMGSGHLYDLEHFQNARQALNPGGIMSQYLPLYQVGLPEARIIVKTFASVFPYVTGWFAFNDLILIGSEKPLLIDLESLRRRMARPEIAQDLREVGIDNEYDFLANYLFGAEAIEEIGAGLPLNTDDYPIIEFMTPKALLGRTTAKNVDYFLNRRVSKMPSIVDLSSLSPDEFMKFNERMQKHFKARRYIIESYPRFLDQQGHVLPALELARRTAAPHSTSSHYIAFVHRARAHGLTLAGNHKAAIEHFETALELSPDDPLTMTRFAVSLEAIDQQSRAADLFERSLALDTEQVLPHLHLARFELERGGESAARVHVERCLALDPGNDECRALKFRIDPRAGS